MRGSTGVSTPPPAWKSTKLLIILGLLVVKVQSYRYRVIIGPLARRHLYDVSLAGRWLPVLVTFFVRASLVK